MARRRKLQLVEGGGAADEATARDDGSLDRGVYLTRYQHRHGGRMMYAIDSRGRQAGAVHVSEEASEEHERAYRGLEALLDVVDPQPTLCLLK